MNQDIILHGQTFIPGEHLVVETITLFDVETTQYVPATVEAYDAICKNIQDATLAHAVSNTLYRAGASTLRARVIAALKEQHGKTPEKDEKPEPFVKRMRAELGVNTVNALIAKAFDDKTVYITALSSSKERGSGGVTKEVEKIAGETRERWASGESSPTRTAELFAAKGIVWEEPSDQVDDATLHSLVARYLKAMRALSL